MTTKAGYNYEGEAVARMTAFPSSMTNEQYTGQAQGYALLAIIDELREANVARVAILGAIGDLTNAVLTLDTTVGQIGGTANDISNTLVDLRVDTEHNLAGIQTIFINALKIGGPLNPSS